MKTLSAAQGLAAATRRHSLSRPGSSIEAISADLVGLHNTSPVSPDLSLQARLPGFGKADLDASLRGTWRMARFRAMRLTMFVFPHQLLEIAAAAIRHIVERLAARWLDESAFSLQEFDRLAAQVDAALSDGPLTVRGLRRAFDIPGAVDLPGVVARMCDRGQLVGGAPPGIGARCHQPLARPHRIEYGAPAPLRGGSADPPLVFGSDVGLLV